MLARATQIASVILLLISAFWFGGRQVAISPVYNQQSTITHRGIAAPMWVTFSEPGVEFSDTIDITLTIESKIGIAVSSVTGLMCWLATNPDGSGDPALTTTVVAATGGSHVVWLDDFARAFLLVTDATGVTPLSVSVGALDVLDLYVAVLLPTGVVVVSPALVFT